MAFLIPLAIAAYSAYQAKSAAGKQLSSEKQAQQAQQDLLKQLQPYGTSFLNNGQNNMNLLQQYLQKLGSGDRNLTMQSLAPEINAINQQYQGSVNAQRGMFPRGGGTTAQNLQLPYQQQGAINNLLFQSRPQAMSQLGQLGANQASLGLGAFGQGAGLTNSMLNYGLNARQQQFEQGNAIGQGLGNLGMLAYQMYGMNRGTPSSSIDVLPTNQTPGFFGSPTSGYTGMDLTPGLSQNFYSGSLAPGSTYSYPGSKP